MKVSDDVQSRWLGFAENGVPGRGLAAVHRR